MLYLDFLSRVHEALAPPTYLEIGIRHGASLALARDDAVGIDPAPRLQVELPASTTVFRQTSDDYFDRPDPLEPFGGRRVALSFIDGLHLAEFVLRDFANVERLTEWSSVVVFDDVLPRSHEEAARERQTREWTGDVFKVLDVLERERPDLTCLRVDTEPTGLLLVLGLDPASRVLTERYEDLVAELAVADPQHVPPEILAREGTLDPEAVLGAGFWRVLREGRQAGTPAKAGRRALRGALRREFPQVSGGSPLRRLLRL